MITSLTRNGVKDFLIQRVSAIVLALYTLTIVAYACLHHPLTYVAWTALFHCPFIKIFTVITLLSLIAHAWVGMWTIFTDYVTCSWLRGILMILMIFGFIAYLVFGIAILWS
jgi:succinate dehydrogenase / fumarate reductase membrane anchor subunit